MNATSFLSSDTTAAVKYGLVAIIVMVLPLLVMYYFMMFPVDRHAGVQSVQSDRDVFAFLTVDVVERKYFF